MASILADYCRKHQLSDAILLSTTLVLLSLATATVGLCLIGIGRLRLASIVTYVPMAAVSGYLAFIGLFAFNAGAFGRQRDGGVCVQDDDFALTPSLPPPFLALDRSLCCHNNHH